MENVELSHKNHTSFRSFVAIELSEEVTLSLRACQDQLKEVAPHVSWVIPENLHLSLVFLGDVFVEQSVLIGNLLDALCGDFPCFELELSGIGFFGSERRPRVLWAGIAHLPRALMELQARVAGQMKRITAFVEKRSYVPHVTIGRVRSNRNLDGLTTALRSVKNTYHGRAAVHEIVLIKSTLAARGAQYTMVHRSSLKG